MCGKTSLLGPLGFVPVQTEVKRSDRDSGLHAACRHLASQICMMAPPQSLSSMSLRGPTNWVGFVIAFVVHFRILPHHGHGGVSLQGMLHIEQFKQYISLRHAAAPCTRRLVATPGALPSSAFCGDQFRSRSFNGSSPGSTLNEWTRHDVAMRLGDLISI